MPVETPLLFFFFTSLDYSYCTGNIPIGKVTTCRFYVGEDISNMVWLGYTNSNNMIIIAIITLARLVICKQCSKQYIIIIHLIL